MWLSIFRKKYNKLIKQIKNKNLDRNQKKEPLVTGPEADKLRTAIGRAFIFVEPTH